MAKGSKTITEDTIPMEGLDREMCKVLTDANLVQSAEFGSLVKRSEGNQERLEHLLISEGFLTEQQLLILKSQVKKWKYVDLDNIPIQDSVASKLPIAFCHSNEVIAYEKKGDKVFCCMHNPDNAQLVSVLRKRLGTNVVCMAGTSSAVLSAITRLEDRSLSEGKNIFGSGTQQSVSSDASVAYVLEQLITTALHRQVSDIHIEPRYGDSLVRIRVDGILYKLTSLPNEVHKLLTLRLKVLSNLPTDVHAIPLDGKFVFHSPEKKRVDIRVSIVPTTKGAKIALRLLVAEEQALAIESIGLPTEAENELKAQINKTWGMILVTGPTGSGKTTTLYSLLRRLNTDKIHIATVEDPVEYDLPGTNQIQVNEKAGLTFAQGLRSLVRQDPDTILVGEIRDEETANVAVNSAMTGHLVLSTLHTNNAATAIPRLTDMGIEPFLIASTVNVIVAQRLIRKICMHCRTSTDLPLATLKDRLPKELYKKLQSKLKHARIYKGTGCPLCNNSGYRGRIGIFEILLVNESIRDAITGRADADTIHREAVHAGMHTMLEDGLQKVLKGMTTIDELLRVIHS